MGWKEIIDTKANLCSTKKKKKKTLPAQGALATRAYRGWLFGSDHSQKQGSASALQG